MPVVLESKRDQWHGGVSLRYPVGVMRRLRWIASVAAVILLTAPLGERVASAGEPTAIPTASEEAEATHARLRGLMSASAIAKLDAGARALAPKTVTKPAKHLHEVATTWAKTTWPEGDIEALVFLVLMEAAKSAQEDLRAIMASVKAINDAKATYREMIEKVQAEIAARGGKKKTSRSKSKPPRPRPLKTPVLGVEYWPAPKVPDLGPLGSMSVAELDAKLAQLTDARDSLAEMGEEQQLRLQMYMDRRQKLFQMLSNIMKKLSDTSGTIIGNLK